MKMTIEALRRRMEQTYFEHTGFTPDCDSDIGLRFQLLASELYSLSLYGDYILQQAFPQSAQGSYLEQHAAARGLYRKTASSATGRLTFYLDAPAQQEIEIPTGTVCACGAEPYIRYATVSRTTIPAGALQGTASARSIGKGNAYNQPVGAVNLLVTPPPGVARVANETAFTGGYDGENDQALRERLLRHMQFQPNGWNKESYNSRLMEIDGILAVNPYRDGDNTRLCLAVRTENGSITKEQREQITKRLKECILLPNDLLLTPAVEKQVPFRIAVMAENGVEGTVLIQAIKTWIGENYSSFAIGETFYPERLRQVLGNWDGVRDYVIESGIAPVTAGANEYIRLTPVEVTSDAW